MHCNMFGVTMQDYVMVANSGIEPLSCPYERPVIAVILIRVNLEEGKGFEPLDPFGPSL